MIRSCLPLIFFCFFLFYLPPPRFCLFQGRLDQAVAADGGEGEEGLGHLLHGEVGHIPVGSTTSPCRSPAAVLRIFLTLSFIHTYVFRQPVVSQETINE